MSADSCWRRKSRTSCLNDCSSSVNSSRMGVPRDHSLILVFCTTEFNSKMVQNYADACQSLSMNKLRNAQPPKRAKQPPQTAIVKSTVKTDRHFVTALGRGLEVLA